MGARFRSWWQKITKNPVRYLVIVFLVVLIILSILGYTFNWDWTGFGPYISPPHSKDSDFQRGKTLWDWLQLLFIPAILTLGAVWLTRRQNHDREIAEDTHQQAALQDYIDKMSELLLEKHLRQSKKDDEVRNIARLLTLAVLDQINPSRKRILLRFLQESGLINKDDTIVELNSAGLSEADLHNASLKGANLTQSDLRRANLHNADLTDTDLTNADLTNAVLNYANLTGADLRYANLTNANLTNANLSEAKLKDVIGITVQELEKQAKSLQGATMPDGKMYSASSGA